MPAITILNHGTSNASGDDLVITRLKSLMHGVKNGSWRLDTGVGTIAAWECPASPITGVGRML